MCETEQESSVCPGTGTILGGSRRDPAAKKYLDISRMFGDDRRYKACRNLRSALFYNVMVRQLDWEVT